MTKPMGQADFFELEAGEYLDKLATLVAAEEPPKPNELLRYARALRGAALMASQADFAESAGALEGVARAYRDGKLEWSRDTSEILQRSTRELKALVPSAKDWGAAPAEKASRVARGLERLSGQPAPATITPPAARRAADSRDRLNAGVRAFVAREGALIASALDRASRALAADPGDRETVHNVVRRMQSLRGLAELTDLSPMPEMLDTLEQIAADLGRAATAPPPNLGALFSQAAAAMTRTARDVADSGKPQDSTDELSEFVKSVVAAFALESDVVPVTQLAGESDPVVERGAEPAPGDPLAATEAVTQGEHLTRLAREVSSASSDGTRRLRLYLALAAMRSIERRMTGELRQDFSALIAGITAVLASGRDATGPAGEAAANAIGEAGGLFQRFHQLDPAGLAQALGSISQAMGGAVPAPTKAAEPPTAPTLAPPKTERPIVPIEALVEQPADKSETVPPAETPRAARAFSDYRQRMRQSSGQKPSIEGLLGTAEAAHAAVGKAPAGEPPLVEVSQLLYSGAAALKRAAGIGQQIDQKMQAGVTLEELRPLIQEVMDLIPLAAGTRQAR